MNIVKFIATFIRIKQRNLFKKFTKIRLKNKEFTIISNNCWGHEVYNFFDLAYLTPFVGLYLYAPCYIKMLGNFDFFMNCELNFIPKSKYGIQEREKEHPIGVLNNEIEIHFLHYETEQIASEKWERRKNRMVKDKKNFFFKFDDQDKCTEELLNKFHNLPFKNKVSFSKKKINYPNNFQLQKSIEYVSFPLTHKHFDMIYWLNKKEIKTTATFRFLKFFDK